MPVLPGQEPAPPALWPLDARPPDAGTVLTDDQGDRFVFPGLSAQEPPASTSAMVVEDTMASGALLTAAAPTSESTEPSTRQANAPA